jgi:gliding motility-associated-like protein
MQMKYSLFRLKKDPNNEYYMWPLKTIKTHMKRILFLIFLALFFTQAKSQIVMSEVCWANKTGTVDGITGLTSDYIELYNATPGFTLSLDNYYLTNSRTNLYMWKMPNGLSIPPLTHKVFWCTGLNKQETGVPYRWHTNFTIEQCMNQWVMLTYNGVIKDSIFVRRTKPDDTWGHYPDYNNNVLPNTPRWYLFNQGAPIIPNFDGPNQPNVPAGNVYYGYAPTPTFTNPSVAGFTVSTTGSYDMWIPDTVNFQINYTQGMCSQLGGQIPCPSYTGCIGNANTPTTYTYQDGITTPIPMTGQTGVITAVTYPKPNGVGSASLAAYYLPSFAETNTYFDGPDFITNPGFGVLSMVVDTTFFRTTASKTIHVEYFDQNKFYSEVGGSLFQPPNDGWLNQQRGFDVSFDDETGEGCRITGNIYNDATFGTSTRTVFPNFEVRAAGKDNFSAKTPTSSTAPPLRTTHMRDAFAQTYAMKVGLAMEGMHYKPIKTFVNGCYWGIYEFREIPDQDYLNYYFNINRDSVDILRQHVVGSVSPPTPLRDSGWVTTPLTGPTQNKDGVFNSLAFNYIGGLNNPYYNNLKKRLSFYSFMDFFIYNSFLVNEEIPTYNMSWWRKTNNGTPANYADTLMKWRYFMWDMNNILDIEVSPVSINTVQVSMMTNPCIYTSTLYPTATFTSSSYTTTPASAYVGHNFMLSKFMSTLGSFDFKNQYMNRYMDLLNTSLRCDKLIQHYNYFKQVFTPEIGFHCAWWAVNQPEWDFAMDTLRLRITQRCEKVDSMLQKCMNLAGPYSINLNVKPDGAGTIDFNSLHVTNFIWSGEYYQTKFAPYYLSYLQAAPTDTSLYAFDHWEWTSNTNSTTAMPYEKNNEDFLFRDSISFVISASDNITAVFVDKRTDLVLPTGFTPNGDGVNDVFSPLGLQAKYMRDYEMQVWNRWGQEVFRSTEFQTGWDGTFNGDRLQTGVYAYMLKYKNVENESKIVKGNVTLIR